MATSSEEVLESVNSDETVEQGEAGNLKDDLEDMEMTDGQSENVKEVVEGNGLASRDTEDVDMEEEATEQSENLLDNSNSLLIGNDDAAPKEVVRTADDDGGGEQQEEPGLEEEHEEEEADGESQEDEEGDVDQGEEGEEGTLQRETGEDVLKDATNTTTEDATNTAAEKLFWFPQGTIKRVMKLDPEVNLVNSEAVFLINKATEQFVECLALEASHFMGGRKTLVGRDIFSAIESQDCLAFLEGAMDD